MRIIIIIHNHINFDKLQHLQMYLNDNNCIFVIY